MENVNYLRAVNKAIQLKKEKRKAFQQRMVHILCEHQAVKFRSLRMYTALRPELQG